jgi:hypothetical protein
MSGVEQPISGLDFTAFALAFLSALSKANLFCPADLGA